jgi:hypothetical protein
MTGRMKLGQIRVSNAMRRCGTVDVDDMSPAYPKPRHDPAIRSNRVIIGRSFSELDPKNPWAQLAGADLNDLPWAD